MSRIPDRWVRGGLFLAITNVCSQLLSIGLNLVLARLLAPADFGLLALSATVVGLVSMLTNASFGAAVIHYQEASQAQISTLYWLTYAQALASFGLIFAGAPWVASFYNEPELTGVVRALAATLLISAVYGTHWKILQRDLRFGTQGWMVVASSLAGGVTAIGSAFAGAGVYALVVHTVTTEIVRAALTLRLSRWRPSLAFRISETPHMIWYAMKFKAAEGVLYVERNIDYAVLGRHFSASQLGYYGFAYNVMYAPVKRVSYVMLGVLFPALSSLKEEPRKLMRLYFASCEVVAMVTFPSLMLCGLFAPEFITILVGDKWLPAADMVRVLCAAGAIQSISQMGGMVFVSSGAPEKEVYLGAVRALLVVAAILIGKSYGLLEVTYLLVVAKVLSYVLLLLMLHQHQPYTLGAWWSTLRRPVFATGAIIILYAGVIQLDVSSFTQLFLTAAFGAAAVLLIHRDLIQRLVQATLRAR